MLRLTIDQVKHVATLARLSLKKEEIRKFQSQLTKILDYAGQVKEIDTEKVKSAGQVTLEGNRMREDEIEPSRILSQEDALGQGKRTYNGFFVVDAVFDK